MMRYTFCLLSRGFVLRLPRGSHIGLVIALFSGARALPQREIRWGYTQTIILALLISVLSLTGCTAIPTQREANTTTLSAADALDRASSYLTEADTVEPAEKEANTLLAARILAEANLIEESDTILQRVDRQQLSPDLSFTYVLLEAQINVARGNAVLAMQQLNAVSNQINEMPPESQRDYYQLMADAAYLSKEPIESIRARVLLDNFLSYPQSRLRNSQQLWTLLQTLSTDRIEGLAADNRDPLLRGWAELALISANAGNIDELSEQVEKWQSQYPDHPANLLFSAESPLAASHLPLPRQSRQIALLVPLSGDLGKSGQAIQHGFLTAYYRSEPFKQKSLGVKTYDTNASPDITTIYQQAVNEGADIIVGPLVKQDIQNLIDKGALQVPTIALNTLDADQGSLFGLLATPDTLYQFGLSPRDEAEQVALKAVRDGKHKALIFVPDNEWGKGVFREFEAAWKNQGGSTVEVIYLPDKTNLAGVVKNALHITQSDMRHTALDTTLGIKTKMIERRRDDIDMIMIAVKPDTARQLVPLFKFYYAGDLPVYATSRIYSGSPNEEADKDLDGVLFCDIPLLLSSESGYQEKQQRLRTLWPDDYQNAPRLYALGADAYTLTQQLNRLVLFPLFTLNGDTGVLSIQNNRRIYRDLAWAKIRNGRIEMIE